MSVRSFVMAAALLAVAVAASAQAPPAQPAPLPTVAAGPAGIAVQSATGDFRLQIGLLAHADGRFELDDEGSVVPNTFLIRRVRPFLRGRFARRFEFYLNPDFAGGTLAVHDASIDTVFSPAFRLRAGKSKTPFGLERLHSASNLLFFERAFPTALVPNRDVGLQVLGDVAGGRLSYAASVSNGVADGASADVDTSDSKDVAARVVVRPLRGLSLALSGSRGRQSGTSALPSFRTVSLQQPFFAYAGTSADGVRSRYSPQVSYYYRSIGGFGEYVHTEMPLTRAGGVRGDVAHDAWQVAGSIVLTGEAATDAGSGVIPRANFDFGAGNWGAFQVAARYHALDIDAASQTLGFAAPGASRTADAWTLGLNWYLTQNFRYTVNFERTVFDGDPGGPRPAENAVLFRTQINF